jgi:hypothetical protein
MGAATRVRFDVREVTGAVGDSITVLPILVALAVTTRVSLAHALLFFGVFQVIWGLRYGLPISGEPMKALAGLAIAGGLTYGEFPGAGLIAVPLGVVAREFDRRLVTLGIGVAGLLVDVGVTFVVGTAAYWVLGRESRFDFVRYRFFRHGPSDR